MIRHTSPISGVDAFGDTYVATAGYDNQVILWDATARRSIARSCHDHLVNNCRFSTDGTRLVSASSDYSARVWSVPRMQLLSLLVGHDDDVEMASFSPDGMLVATASRDCTIGLFEAGGRMLRRLEGHGSDVLSVEWTAGGTQLMSTGDDGTVRRWCVETGRQLDAFSLDGETDTIVVVGEGRILAGNDRGEIVVIFGDEVRTVPAHAAGIKRLVYEPSRRLLVSLSYDATIRVWSTHPNGALGFLFESAVPDQVWLRSCCFAGPDDLAFATFGSSYATFSLSHRRWDLEGVESTRGLNAVRVAGEAVYAVGDAGVVFRDGRPIAEMGSLCNFIGAIGEVVVTGGQRGTLFDARDGREIYRHHSPLNCCTTFVRNHEPHLAVGTYTGEVLVFALTGGDLAYVCSFRMHDNAIKGLAANDHLLFGVCATGAAAFHATRTLERVRFVPDGHRKISNGAAVLPDGRFASVSRDLSLRIWSVDDVEEHPSPHRHSIKCVATSPHGAMLATGAYDGSVALFDWQRSRWVHTSRPTASGISSLCPASATDHFLASSYDGQLFAVTAPVLAAVD